MDFDLEETPKLIEPLPKKLTPVPAPTVREVAFAKTTRTAERAGGNYKDFCYICANSNCALTRVLSAGMLICESCSVLHLCSD